VAEFDANAIDLNKLLGNLVVTFANRARAATEEAAELGKQLEQDEVRFRDAPEAQANEMRRVARVEIGRATGLARLWSDRSKVAKLGNLLERPQEEGADVAYLTEFGQVRSAAYAQGRVVTKV
jgi:hypothetical protein